MSICSVRDIITIHLVMMIVKKLDIYSSTNVVVICAFVLMLFINLVGIVCNH